MSSSNWETTSNPRSLEFVLISKNSFNQIGKQIEFWKGSNWSKSGNNWRRILWKSSKKEMPLKIDQRALHLSSTRTAPPRMYFIKRIFTKTSIMLYRSLWISLKSNIASKINLMSLRQNMRSGNWNLPITTITARLERIKHRSLWKKITKSLPPL